MPDIAKHRNRVRCEEKQRTCPPKVEDLLAAGMEHNTIGILLSPEFDFNFLINK